MQDSSNFKSPSVWEASVLLPPLDSTARRRNFESVAADRMRDMSLKHAQQRPPMQKTLFQAEMWIHRQ